MKKPLDVALNSSSGCAKAGRSVVVHLVVAAEASRPVAVVFLGEGLLAVVVVATQAAGVGAANYGHA